ncbi:MAG: hypothetical protein JWM99_1544 [Verrucomicrobiales bacterium]|nr:hypothetical protein [Verrucomicrobiales bacterium]
MLFAQPGPANQPMSQQLQRDIVFRTGGTAECFDVGAQKFCPVSKGLCRSKVIQGFEVIEFTLAILAF